MTISFSCEKSMLLKICALRNQNKSENETINQIKPENIVAGREPFELPSTLMNVTSWNGTALTVLQI